MKDKNLTNVTDNNVGKMTDNEVIKALECLEKYTNCGDCAVIKQCKGDCVFTKTLNLINRLKAENERLKNENKLLIDNDVRNKYPNCVLVEKGRIYTKTLDDYDELIADISFEATKEFAERLEDRIADRLDQSLDNPDGNNYFITDVFTDIKNISKELVGDKNVD